MLPKMSSRAEGLLIGVTVFVVSMALLATVYATGRRAWIVAFLIGLGLIAYGAGALHRAASVESWLRVRGRVLETKLGEVLVPMKSGSHVEYYPVVTFEYGSVGGHFTSDRFTIAPRDYRNRDRAESERLLTQYPAGATVDVRICPRDHRLAVLCSEISRKRRSQYLAAFIGGALVCGVSLWAALPTAL